MANNAYIHIPFCKSKCNYCTFVSFATLRHKEAYVKALIKQISAEYLGEYLDTLYLGGGTPSLLSLNELENILSLFNFNSESEVTMEINPENVDFEYFLGLKFLGINRISIGAQTFNDKILKIIGRGHSSLQTKNAIEAAHRAGIKNISVDLIYGLPKQNIFDFELDLAEISQLEVQHVSLYGLKIEQGCYFYRKRPEVPSLDIQADMYLKAIEVLQRAKFYHYEISNFSKDGYESKHNTNYWNNNSYYGFGCAASGYLSGKRFQMMPRLVEYIKNPCFRDFEELLTPKEILEEEIFLGLRKVCGINIFDIEQKFNINFREKYSKVLTKYSKYFKNNNQKLSFTNQGFLISDMILAEFIDD